MTLNLFRPTDCVRLRAGVRATVTPCAAAEATTTSPWRLRKDVNVNITGAAT